MVDFGLWGALTAPSIAEIAGQRAEGAMGFKAFMPRSDPSYPHVSDAEFLDGMRAVKAAGGLVLVHAESDSLLQAGIARMRAAGRRDPLAHHESRPAFIEEEAVHRALYLARHAGVRIQIVHVSSPVSAELVRDEKRAGRPVTMEICPHHLLLDLDDLVRLGPYGACAPALRERALVERLWDSVRDGTADCLVSDHSAYTRAEKDAGWDDIFAAPLGCQVMQETMPLVLDEAYHRRGAAARRVRALLVDERGAHQRHLSPQGHAAARRRCRHRPLRPRPRVAGRGRKPAVLQEPVVALRGPPGACARRAHDRARRDRVRGWRDPGPAGLGSLPLVPRRLRARVRRPP